MEGLGAASGMKFDIEQLQGTLSSDEIRAPWTAKDSEDDLDVLLMGSVGEKGRGISLPQSIDSQNSF